MNYKQFLSIYIIITYFGTKIPIFLLQIGYFGLKCPFLAQKALIALKKGPLLSKPAFLDRFLFHYKTYFAVNSHFLAKESPWWSQDG